MTTRSVLAWCVALMAAVAGLAGGVAGFHVVQGADADTVAAQETDDSGRDSARDRSERRAERPVVVRVRPCPADFQRQGNTCVRTVQRTVLAGGTSVAGPSGGADDGAFHDQLDDHGGDRPAGVSDDGPLHDVGDDHGGAAGVSDDGDDHSGHGGDDDHGDDEDHSGHGGGGSDDHDDDDDDDDDDDHSGHGGGDDD